MEDTIFSTHRGGGWAALINYSERNLPRCILFRFTGRALPVCTHVPVWGWSVPPWHATATLNEAGFNEMLGPN